MQSNCLVHYLYASQDLSALWVFMPLIVALSHGMWHLRMHYLLCCKFIWKNECCCTSTFFLLFLLFWSRHICISLAHGNSFSLYQIISLSLNAIWSLHFCHSSGNSSFAYICGDNCALTSINMYVVPFVCDNNHENENTFVCVQ